MPAAAPQGPLSFDRLLRRQDFLAASRASRWNCDAFGLQMRARADAPLARARFGITITKKIAPSAVERNRMRRRLREALRLGAALAATPAHDYVIVGRRPLLDMPFETLRSSLAGAIGTRPQRRSGGERPTRTKSAPMKPLTP
jgi:ribonuclease P protein component